MQSATPKILVTVPSRTVEEFDPMKKKELEVALIANGITPNIDIVTEKGYGNAIRNSWLKKPGYDVYVCWDNDFAVSVDYIPIFARAIWYEGYDVVVGARRSRVGGKQVLRGIVSQSFSTLLGRLFGIRATEMFSGFRAYSSTFVQEVLPETVEKHWMWQPECVIAAAKLWLSVIEIEVPYDTTQRPTPLTRISKDMMDILPGVVRLMRDWMGI